MQITAPITILPVPAPGTGPIDLPTGPINGQPPVTTMPVDPTPGPIGVTSFGTVRIGHAMNGISYTEHKLLAPITAPIVFRGSYADAVAGTQALAAKQNEVGERGRSAFALIMGIGGAWNAVQLMLDTSVVRAFEYGPGTGGIASIEFPVRSRSLAAIVTEAGPVRLDGPC